MNRGRSHLDLRKWTGGRFGSRGDAEEDTENKTLLPLRVCAEGAWGGPEGAGEGSYRRQAGKES